MSIQSDAAKGWIRRLLADEYDQVSMSASEMKQNGGCLTKASVRSVQNDMIDGGLKVFEEYYFTDAANWRFDYAVPSILCAKSWGFHQSLITPHPGRAIELDGGTFQSTRTGHASGVGLRNWREKNNAAMSAGWRVWHYSPEEVIRSGRKSSENGMMNGLRSCLVPLLRNPAR